MATPAGTAPTARSVGIDALLYIPGRAIPAVVQVLTVTLLTVYFTPETIGQYDLAFRFALLLCTATVLWLNMAVLRLYPACAQEGTLDAFFNVLAWLRYAMLAAGTAAGLLCWRFGPDALVGEYRALLPHATLVFIGYTAYESGLAVLRTKRMPLRYSIAASANALVRLPLAAALFQWWHFGVSGMLWSLTITYFVAHAAFLWGQTGRVRLEFGERERRIARTLLLYGLPVAGAQLLNFFLGNLDRYFLQTLRGPHDVGLYSVATNLIEQPLMLLFQTFTMAVFPSVVSAWEQHGRGSAEELLRGITRIFIVACVPAGVFLATFSQPLCEALARGESAQAYTAAPWIALAAILYGLHYLANFGLHLAHRTGQLLVATVAALAMNAALNYWLVPLHGFVGAGMARTGANLFFVALLVLLSRPHLHWHFPWASCLKVAAASVAGGVAGELILDACAALSPLPRLIAVGLVYTAVAGVALVITREVPLAPVLRRLRRRPA